MTLGWIIVAVLVICAAVWLLQQTTWPQFAKNIIYTALAILLLVWFFGGGDWLNAPLSRR